MPAIIYDILFVVASISETILNISIIIGVILYFRKENNKWRMKKLFGFKTIKEE